MLEQSERKNEGVELENCLYCGATFTKKEMSRHKADEEKALLCSYCDITFVNVRLLRRHMYRYHKYYSCKTCNLKLLKGPYEYHMRSLHKSRAECHACNKTFATQLGLLAHQKKIHSGQKDDRWKCRICLYHAPDKYHWKIHQARHRKEPTLFCERCGVGHYTQGELRKHMQADHAGGFGCDICKKSFRSKEYLNKHRRAHLAERDTNIANFTCEQCGKSFVKHISFKRHVLKHKGELPLYSCHYCSKDLTTKASYTAHVRTHTGIKPFVCDTCGKAFSVKRYLKDHSRQHISE